MSEAHNLEEMATSNDGIATLAAALSELPQNEDIQKAINRPTKTPAAPEAPAEEPEEEEE